MADNTPNPYAPTKFEGPFSNFLSAPIVKSAPHESPGQFTGWEGGAGSALGLASKFLAGVGKGRMMTAMAQEQEKTQKMQRYIAWGDSVMNNPNIDPNKKAEFQQEFQQALLHETTGALDQGMKKDPGMPGGKGGGHPIVGALKSILGGLAGGEVVKSKYDLKAIDGVITKYHDLATDPKYNVQAQTQQALNDMRGAISNAATELRKNGQPVTQQAVQQMLPKEVLTNLDMRTGGKSGQFLTEELKQFLGAKEQPELAPALAQLRSAVQTATDNLRKEGKSPTKEAIRQALPNEIITGIDRLTGGESGKYIDEQIKGFQEAPKIGSKEEMAAAADAKLNEERARKAQAPPPPPGTPPPAPSVTQVEREYLTAHNLISDPKFVKVGGKERQLQYTFGGGGVASGFIDVSTGEYIDPKSISQDKTTKDTYKVAIDDKGKYGSKGGRYFVDQDNGKPLKDEQGDIVRPPESQVTTLQNQLRSQIARNYQNFKTQNAALDKEQEARVAALAHVTIRNPDGTTMRNLTPAEIEQRKSGIYDDIKRRKSQNKTDTDQVIRATASMYGMPVQPFMEQEEADDLGIADDDDDAPAGKPTKSSNEWTIPK